MRRARTQSAILFMRSCGHFAEINSFRSDSRTDKYALSRTEAKYLDREGARCIEETDNTDHSELSDCITDYINTRLGCILPWTGAKLNKTGNWTHCHSYEHVSFDMTTPFNTNHM